MASESQQTDFTKKRVCPSCDQSVEPDDMGGSMRPACPDCGVILTDSRPRPEWAPEDFH